MTIAVVNGLIIVFLLVLFNLKLFNNSLTEHQPKSLTAIVKQSYFGHIIDANVGRFIKLREFRPNQVTFDKPSRDYLSHIVPGSVERKDYRVETDQDGFIVGPDGHHDKPDVKIVFLGGSTTECLFVDEDKRFPYLVKQNLQDKTNLKINTYNGGVSANESMHSINILMNKVLPLKPDVVVMMHNINDLVMLRPKGSYWYQTSRKSHVQTSKNVFTRYEIPEPLQSFDEEIVKAEFVANLKTFVAINKIRGIKPVLMTQANRVEQDDLYHEFNNLIRQVAHEEDITLIDLAKEIPSSTQLIYDSYHLTNQGSIQAAKVIAEHLVKNLV